MSHATPHPQDVPAADASGIREWFLDRVLERSRQAADTRTLAGVQAARGIAALAVIVSHALSTLVKVEGGVIALPGLYGVALFFVISGYIMVRTTGTGTFDPWAFMSRRLRRIVPLYYIATALLAFAALTLPYSFKTTTVQPLHILKSLLFIPAWAPRAPGEILPFYKLGWTLNMEMFFYVVFASLCFLTARARVWVITMAFGAFISLGRLLIIDFAILKFYTYPIVMGFVAGMWLARVELDRQWRLTPAAAGALLVTSLASMAGIARHYHLFVTNELLLIGWLTLTVAAQMIFTLFYVDRGGLRVPVLLRATGDASYSLYLFHMFAIGLVFVAVRRLLGDQLILGVVMAVASATIAGLIVHRVIEMPLMVWFSSRGRGNVRAEMARSRVAVT